VKSLFIFGEGEHLVTALLCVMILSVSNGKGRYYYLILFIVAACAAFYFLLYLYR